jgi:hypothetical protein
MTLSEIFDILTSTPDCFFSALVPGGDVRQWISAPFLKSGELYSKNNELIPPKAA